MKNKPILTIENLTKVYETGGEDVVALNDVSFHLTEGELLAVMGTSGSGKSTLLNLLGAMDTPTSGYVKVQEYTQMSYKEPEATHFRRENIGFIFQSFHLLKDLSVEENIAMPLILKGVEDHIVQEKLDEMIQMLNLENWRKHRPVQLSGGQQQRVAIGRALITSPPIILADEPTGNLDYNTSQDILNMLLNMREQLNQSMIVVTHDPSVAAYADRVLFFHDGEIVDEYICLENEQNIEPILKKFKRILEIEK